MKDNLATKSPVMLNTVGIIFISWAIIGIAKAGYTFGVWLKEVL